TGGLRLVVADDEADLARGEADERADREEAEQPDERADDARVVSAPGRRLEDGQGLPALLGLPVLAAARERVEAVGDRDDAGRERGHSLAGEGRVPGAVVRGVVFEHHRERR